MLPANGMAYRECKKAIDFLKMMTNSEGHDAHEYLYPWVNTDVGDKDDVDIHKNTGALTIIN